MEFDLVGHLSPYTIIHTTFEEFESVLGQPFPIDSTRHGILDGYKRYLLRLKNLIGSGFYQWIDGSFVTEKMNPNDIDIVTFVDYNIFFRNEQALSSLIAPESKLIYKVDAAFIPVYPQNHRLSMVTDWDINFWKGFYGNTRPDEHQTQMQKGFIQLNF